jgi:hypothetical protein
LEGTVDEQTKQYLERILLNQKVLAEAIEVIGGVVCDKAPTCSPIYRDMLTDRVRRVCGKVQSLEE